MFVVLDLIRRKLPIRKKKRNGLISYSRKKVSFFFRNERQLLMIINIRKKEKKIDVMISVGGISNFIKPTINHCTCFVEDIWNTVFIG